MQRIRWSILGNVQVARDFVIAVPTNAWIERKKRVVDRYGHSSFYVGTLCASQGVTFEEKSRLDRDGYAAAGGCFPVIVRNVGPVGTVTVSGLPQAEDHALVVRVLREFLAGGGDRSAD
jgi:uncharacterized protein (UPF0303 family)